MDVDYEMIRYIKGVPGDETVYGGYGGAYFWSINHYELVDSSDLSVG